MKTLEEYQKEKIYDLIGEKRYKHTISVVKTIDKLAKYYSFDLKKAKIAGWLHDLGKIKPREKYEKYLHEYSIELDEYERNFVELAHGKLSAAISKEKFGIEDEEILEAIRIHTTGKQGMNMIDKIVFLADYIEPLRKHQSSINARKLAFDGKLNESLILAMDETIKFVIEKNQLLHIETVNARNELILEGGSC